MTRVFVSKIPEMSEGDFERFSKRVSVERREKAEKLKIHSKKCQALAVELLLRAVLVAHFGMNESDIVIEKTPEGKPYLKGDNSFCISLSHCEGVVAVAVSDNEVGVDVERVRTIDSKIANRFFTKSEQEYVFKNDSTATEHFFEIWTRKEALAKLNGQGLSADIHTCTIENADRFKSFDFQGYKVSVCTSENSADDVSFSSATELLSEYII